MPLGKIFMEWGFLLPPGKAARHSSGHLRTQNLKAQVQISTLLKDQCHMSVPSHPSCPNAADSREETDSLCTEFDTDMTLTASMTKLEKCQAQSPCKARNAETIRRCGSLLRTH